jgi:hypothetical protein
MSNIASRVGFDPVHVLGCSAAEAAVLLQGRRISPGEVESLAMSHYEWWRHLRDPRSYWVTTSQAARILHLSPGRVLRMLEEDSLPHVRHSSGVRLMRRDDIVERARRGGQSDDPDA